MLDTFEGAQKDRKAQKLRARIIEVATELGSDKTKSMWREVARLEAILGSCPRSIEKVKSGLRCWFDFRKRLGDPLSSSFPPSLTDLLAYANIFDCAKTFSNYVTHIKIGCELLDRPVDIFEHPSLSRAITAIVKRGSHEVREPMFIRFLVVQGLVRGGIMKPTLAPAIMLFLAAYTFMLRVPSEGLPVTVCHQGVPDAAETPCVVPHPDALEWFFPRRKNTAKLTRVFRECWCKTCTITCPVHALGKWFREQPDGSQPFVHFRKAWFYFISE